MHALCQERLFIIILQYCTIFGYRKLKLLAAVGARYGNTYLSNGKH